MSSTINMDLLQQKHDANDFSLFRDFQNIVMKIRDTHLIQRLWERFPNAAWTRACGFLVEDMALSGMHDMLRLFWDHDMFRMGGRDRAEQFTRLFQKECVPEIKRN